MQIDEDTHLSLRSEERVIGSVPLRENVPSKSVRPISRSDRKNLAVHVSLSSIFTMSKSGPQEPLSRKASVKQELLNFGNRRVLPVARQHLCHSLNFAAGGPQGRRHQRGGLYAGTLLGVNTRKQQNRQKTQRRLATLETRGNRGLSALLAGARNVGSDGKKCKSPIGRTAFFGSRTAAAGLGAPRTCLSDARNGSEGPSLDRQTDSRHAASRRKLAVFAADQTIAASA